MFIDYTCPQFHLHRYRMAVNPLKRARGVVLSSSIFLIILASLTSCRNPVKKEEALSDYLKGKSHYAKGELRPAETLLRDASKKDPRLFQADFLLGKTLFFQEKGEEAGEIFRELIKTHPAYREAETWLVRIDIQEGRLEEAEERLKRLLSYDSNDPGLLYLMAQIYLTRDDLKNAIDFLRKAALFGEEMSKIHLDLGRIYYQFQMEEKALEELNICLHLLPEESLLVKPVLRLIDTINGERR